MKQKRLFIKGTNSTRGYIRVEIDRIVISIDIWSVEVSSLQAGSLPLFSQPLLTVEQLTSIHVDTDIKTAVADFLKGLNTQMFARYIKLIHLSLSLSLSLPPSLSLS